MSKKLQIIKKTIFVFFIVFLIYFLLINVFNIVFCKANLTDDFTINYSGKTYRLYSDIYDYTVLEGEPSKFVGIRSNSFFDYILFPREYIYHLEDTEDVNTNFIVYESLTTLVFVKEGFSFPDIKENPIEAVWFSWDTDLDAIKDEYIIDKLVLCAKEGENRPLNKELYEIITDNNGFFCCFKFKDYPIVANFCVKTTKDGLHYLKEEEDKYTVFLDQDFLEDKRG